MADESIKIDVDPGQALQKAMRKAAEQVSDLQIPLKLIAQQWFRSNNAIFTLQGPGKYPPFKNSVRASLLFGGEEGRKRSQVDVTKSPYQQRKIKEYGHDYPLLLRGGELALSITDPTNSYAVNYIVNKISLALGTAVPYAIYHQSKKPRSVMPYRPMILFGNEQVAPGALKGRVEQWRKEIFAYVSKVSGAKPLG